MDYPIINIVSNDQVDFEAKYICFLAKNISLGQYQDNGFLVLPHLERGNSKAIHFPDLGYSKDFWKAINVNSNNDLSANYSQKAIGEVKNALSKYKKEKFYSETLAVTNDWARMEQEFFNDVEKFLHFEKALDKVEKINILITSFGTRGSFNPPRVGNKFNLNVTSRVDYPAGNIALSILQNLYIIDTGIGGEIGDKKYLKRMSAISFLMTLTIFNKYYLNFTDLTKPRFTTNQDLVTQSDKYLAKLGFNKKNINMTLDGKELTVQENSVYKLLLKNAGEYLSFDEIADALWGGGSDDKYSLEAMAKVIENLRRKIGESGINKELIFTKRGRGYMFVR